MKLLYSKRTIYVCVFVFRWWTTLGISNKFTFARDRLMECFFRLLGMADDEPQLSNCRKALTKVATLLTIFDDIYDVYGTLDELELFTYVVNRFILVKI